MKQLVIVGVGGMGTDALWVANSVITALFAKRGRITRELRNPFLVLVFMLLSRFIAFPLIWLGNVVNRGDCLVITATKA